MKKALVILGIILLILAGAGLYAGSMACRTYGHEPLRLNINRVATEGELKKILVDSLGKDYGMAVFRLWSWRKGSVNRVSGSYRVTPDMPAYRLAMNLRGGLQSPVDIVVPSHRSLDRVIEVTASQLRLNAGELRQAFDSVALSRGFSKAQLPAVILPDKYQYYWTASPEYVATSILNHWENYWNESRREKARRLGLTPAQVSTLASIVEEESAKRSEHTIIARLYLNRLDRHMRLQADPTVKYAVGDPTLKRILNKHLATESPYNTYQVDGLPPGPIRVVEKSTIDAVLDAPSHNYLYMCAKEDFSGYHNFTSSLSQHNINAQKYHQALSNVKK